MSTNSISINDPALDPTDQPIDLGTFDPGANDRAFPAYPRPGTHLFTFHLAETDPIALVDVKEDGVVTGKTIQINYEVETEVAKKDGGTYAKRLKFLSASFRTYPPKEGQKPKPSKGVKLMEATGYDAQKGAPLTQELIEQHFRSIDGRQQFKAKTGLAYYDKETKLETTTNSWKKDGTQATWPRNAQGEWEMFITNSGGERVSGKVTLTEFYRLRG